MKRGVTNNWEVSILAVRNDQGIKFKVTRRMPSMNVAETRVFKFKKDADNQYNEWLK